jgi:thiamine transporter
MHFFWTGMGGFYFMFLSLLSASDLFASITNYFANFKNATNTCRTVMLWLAIALVVAFIICKLAIKKDKQPLVNKISLFVALGYAALSIVMFTVLSFIDDDVVAITFYPLLVLAIACILGALAVALKGEKWVKITAGCVIGAAFIAAIVCMIVYYVSGDAGEWNWVSNDDVNEVGLYIAAVALVAVIALIAVFSDKNSKPFDSRSLAFAAVCVALSFALSYVRFFRMPMGGSITFASMLPIMLFAYMFGARKGVIAGIVYGILQAVQDPWLLHPAQFVLDYGTSFAAVGLTGCIRGFGLFEGKTRLQFTVGSIIAGVLRFISHFFAGAFAFGSFGAENATKYGIEAFSNPYFYSFVYQSMYVIPEIIIAIVVGVILLSSKNFVKQVERYSAENKVKADTVTKA